MPVRRAILIYIFIYIHSQYHIWRCGAQRVTFDIDNPGFNGVAFVGERNVVFRCCTENITSDMIRIEHPLGTVLRESRQAANCSIYRLDEVHFGHAGEYVCRVNYTCVGSGHGSEVLMNYLEVLSNQSEVPQCVRNGTHGEPYKPGDRLLLSCYCRDGDMCNWVSTVEGSGLAGNIENHRVYRQNGTEILQILVHYTADTNSSTRYDCFYLDTTGPSSVRDRRCSVGPEGMSHRDAITAVPLGSQICTIPSMEPTATKEYHPTSSSAMKTASSTAASGNDHMEPRLSIYTVIAAGGICLFLVFLIVILIIIYCWRLRKMNLNNRKISAIAGEGNVHHDNTDSHVYYNGTTVDISDSGDGSSGNNRGVRLEPSTSSETAVSESPDNNEANGGEILSERPVMLNDEYAAIGRAIGPRHDTTGTHFGMNGAGAAIGLHGERNFSNDDYAEVGESMKSQSDNREASFELNNSEPPILDSIQSGSVHQKQREERRSGGDGTDDDFSKLCAVVDKERRGEIHGTPVDFSDLYSKVNKSRGSEQYQ